MTRNVSNLERTLVTDDRRSVGEHAVVIGAGVAGLAAAATLAAHYDRVSVLERDRLPAEAVPRPGVPQGEHIHVLLAGGLRALGEIYPGFEHDLKVSGAVPLTLAYDVRAELHDYLPHEPRRDLGIHSFSLSRPLLESCLRARAQALRNVQIETRAHVDGLVVDDRKDVVGVAVRGQGERRADLVVDASGRGQPTLEALEALGLGAPPTTVVGTDVHYASAVFELPDGLEGGWKTINTSPGPKRPARGALMAAIEGKQFMVSLGGASDDLAPSDPQGFVEWARGLSTDTIYKALSNGRIARKVRRYNFKDSYRRHFDRMPRFPAGLIAMGDSLCRLNPVYGQGMSVAALEARTLGSSLASVSSGSLDVRDLASAFWKQTDELIESAWAMSALLDLLNPATAGERPADLMERAMLQWAVNQLSRRDESVHRLTTEIRNLLKPLSAWQPLEGAARTVLAERMAQR
jgi:2-polyprenyl-6-methoxyphenol hydroxylase-like FAD-dependent oxidoreductase